jgi:hypothetical protein
MAVIFFLLLLSAVEASRSVRTGDNTVFTSEASPKVLHNNAIFAAIRGLGRAHGHTWGMIALHARHRDEFGIHLRIFTIGYGDHFIPVNVSSEFLIIRRTMRNVVFVLAGG